jgi:hypothetical protein
MKIDVKLFPLNVRSTSGTDIPSEVFNEYLESDRCKDALKRKIMIGGLTHVTRDMPKEFEGKIGLDDVQLLDGNATHYIEKFWVNPDGYVYCTASVFDPELFDEKQAGNIKRLTGYLKSGINLGVSVVVDAVNDKMTGKAMQLLAIVGFDFTFNPAFKDTKIVKIYE